MIIAITGAARAGKGTIAATLVEEGFKEMMFSSTLKKAALKLDPIVKFQLAVEEVGIYIKTTRLKESVENLGWEEAKKIPEVRRTLQRLGTDVFRDLFGQEVHINFLEKELQYWRTHGYRDFVISDTRFDDEAEFSKSNDGLVWQVRSNRESDLTEEGSKHASEAGVDSTLVDKVFDNFGTIEDLREKVINELQTLRARR